MLASARALQGDADGAFGYLEKAADNGFSDPATVLRDKNMASLAQGPKARTIHSTNAGRLGSSSRKSMWKGIPK